MFLFPKQQLNNCKAAILVLLSAAGGTGVMAVDKASPIAPSLLNTEPYAHNGMINSRFGSGGARGSGALVHPRVLLTAAHVVFDEESLTWVSDVNFDLKRNANYQEAGRRTVYTVTGSQVWTEYSTEVSKGKKGGIWPFNLDFAAGYRAGPSSFPSTYAAYTVKEDDSVSPLRDEVDKLIVGYPLDSEKVPTANQGLMHRVGPKNLQFFDHLESYGGTEDSHGFPYAVYRADDLEVYGGNSGGPIYVYDEADEGRWLQAGVITGGSASGRAYTILRGIDERAHELIVKAIQASGFETVYRPEEVSVEAEPGAISLTWTDNSPKDAGWQIFRHDGANWSLVAQIAADETAPATGEELTFVDDLLNPGQVYLYKVRAMAEDGGVSPWSRVQTADAIGANVPLGDALDASRLTWITGGDAAWFPEGSGARSGMIRSESESWIETRVTGPGTLTFDWSASTELPDPPRIYDNLTFTIDGETARQLYGENSGKGLSFKVDEGVHVFRWTYSKDPYSVGGDDVGRLSNVRYTTDDADQLIDGAYETKGGWLYAHWFGYFFPTGDGHWIWHEAFGPDNGGWVYLTGDHNNLWLYTLSSDLGWLYTSPDSFPYLWSQETGNWIAWAGMENWFYDTIDAHFFRI